jgi:hypothetical protein
VARSSCALPWVPMMGTATLRSRYIAMRDIPLRDR